MLLFLHLLVLSSCYIRLHTHTHTFSYFSNLVTNQRTASSQRLNPLAKNKNPFLPPSLNPKKRYSMSSPIRRRNPLSPKYHYTPFPLALIHSITLSLPSTSSIPLLQYTLTHRAHSSQILNPPPPPPPPPPTLSALGEELIDRTRYYTGRSCLLAPPLMELSRNILCSLSRAQRKLTPHSYNPL